MRLPNTSPVLRSLPRPVSIPRAAQPPPASVRWKSGAYGYRQAKALVFQTPGEPVDVLQLHLHSVSPSLPSSHVLLRTLAAPINPADINLIQGKYGASPPMTTDLGTNAPSVVPGSEGCLEVVSVAEDLSSSSPSSAPPLKPGDWVIPSSSFFGTWRTHVVAPASTVFRIDKTDLSPVEAATVSINPCTAYRLLRAFGPATPGTLDASMTPLAPGSGDWFIQNGANSGVGRAAIQFGKQWGLRSINVVRERESPSDTEALKAELNSLGADVVVTESEVQSRTWSSKLATITRDGREPVGLALNGIGGKSATALARSLSQGGTMVTYGSMSRQPTQLPPGLLIFKDIRLLGFWLSRWADRDPVGKGHAVEDVLNMMRARKFRGAPVEEVKWSWDSTADNLVEGVKGGLGGFKRGKAVFVFDKDTD